MSRRHNSVLLRMTTTSRFGIVWAEFGREAVISESVNQDTKQVRIQVKHVSSGATRTFLQWSQAIAFIEDQIQEEGSNNTVK